MPSLDELLVQTRALSPMQLTIVRRDAEMRRKRLAPTIVDLNLIDEKRFAEWMAGVTGLPIVHPLPEDEVSRLERRIPRATARQYEVVPIALEGDQLTVATIDPLDAEALEVLRATSGFTIRPVIARYGDLMRLVTKFYPEDDAEPTMLPGAFPPVESSESAPFDFGSNTLMASHREPFTIPDEGVGSTTQIFTPRPDLPQRPSSDPPPSQLDRIETALTSIERMLLSLERRVDAIEQSLSRVLPR